uniref:Putative Amidophosphoribosyltransferase, chloroplastic n=1 Tax=Aegilops tauschii TaxID=37682 RepID=N1QZY0_AEGTA
MQPIFRHGNGGAVAAVCRDENMIFLKASWITYSNHTDPETSEAIAASGLEFQQGLIRSHYTGRSFIQPTQAIRDLAVKLKLAPVRGVITGKSVVVVDDSIVRGTTSSKIVRLLRDAGAREVHMRISSPPVVGRCHYGIDTPDEKELISNRLDVEGVREMIGCDSLGFLTLDKLHSIYGDEADELCDACFSRNYPVPMPDKVPAMASADDED